MAKPLNHQLIILYITHTRVHAQIHMHHQCTHLQPIRGSQRVTGSFQFVFGSERVKDAHSQSMSLITVNKQRLLKKFKKNTHRWSGIFPEHLPWTTLPLEEGADNPTCWVQHFQLLHFQTVPCCSFCSPWYNRTGWLGVKQLTYLPAPSVNAGNLQARLGTGQRTVRTNVLKMQPALHALPASSQRKWSSSLCTSVLHPSATPEENISLLFQT